jgi:large subunit ribosomal protein L25
LEILELKAEKRSTVGKGPARSLRRDGKIPAVLYGSDIEPVPLSIQAKEIEVLLKNAKFNQQLINIDMGSGVMKPTMIKEIQLRPVKGDFLHIDFYEVNMGRKIRVRVPVVLKGKSIGVENGGLLQIIRRDLEVLCYPGEIPEAIEIDVTDLNIGNSVHVNDIHLEGDMEIPAEVNFTVVTMLAPKKESIATEDEGVEAEAVAGEAAAE